MANAVALGDVASKYSLKGLIEFLKDPTESRPHGRMPSLKLTHWEATDIASFLLHTDKSSDSNSFELDQSKIDVGRLAFRKMKCSSCHQLDATETSTPKEISLASANPQKGCLSGQSGNWPTFDLTDQQSAVIRAGDGKPRKAT